ncbi:hypothetical protein MPSEU_000554300 [Mayamaea pseudoterrestris]|nr:hypothetical protein MPSEU_000554300 [Mayamaea pseudoterrestris]
MSSNTELTTTTPGALSIGLCLHDLKYDAAASLKQAQLDGFDFITTGVCNNVNNNKNNNDNKITTRSDVLALSAKWWRSNVVGILDHDNATNMWSKYIDDDSTPFDFCHHMQLPAVILPSLGNSTTTTDGNTETMVTDIDEASMSATSHHELLIHQYASRLGNVTTKSSSSSMQYWVPVPCTRQGLQDWQLFYQLVGRNSNVKILLQLQPIGGNGNNAATADSFASQMRLLHVFLGEPVAAVGLSTKLFLTNRKGFPTLAKLHQVIVTHTLTRIGRTVKFILFGPSLHTQSLSNLPQALGATGCLPYRQYLQHLRSQSSVVSACDSPEASMECNYLDRLQKPLQPLSDHLDYETYETFERDPVKYVKYQEAIYMALQDLIIYNNNSPPQQVTVFVVGAGRGPLVTAVMDAFESLDQITSGKFFPQLNIVVVEKNPSAVLILQSRAQADPQWQKYAAGGNLVIVPSDLRNVTLESYHGKRADIVVSELLGSFGDNELSPECLDSFYATAVCQPSTISIPSRYTSYVALVNSAKLHAQAQQQALYPNEHVTNMVGMVKAMETPYVVRTHACSQMSAEQECWVFEHPSSSKTLPSALHDRDCVLNFEPASHGGCGYGSGYGHVDANLNATTTMNDSESCGLSWTCTGLLGTFSADLYTGRNGQGTSCISIAPTNFSVGMFSWFPLYFPIHEPLLVPAGASVRVYLWRKQSLEQSKVWYEWALAVHRNGEMLSTTNIHNPGGRSYSVSMK